MVASPSGAPRRGRPGYDQATVLRRAIDLFNRQGYEATSMADLAKELGLTKSAIYHHVDSREDLLSAALDEALDGLTAAIGSAVEGPPGTSAAERLRTAVQESVRILVEHLPAVTLLLRVRGNSEIERQALARRRRLDRLVAELVARAVRDGDLRPDVDPAVTARLLFGTVNSLTEWLTPGKAHDADQLADTVTAMVFDGLRVHP